MRSPRDARTVRALAGTLTVRLLAAAAVFVVYLSLGARAAADIESPDGPKALNNHSRQQAARSP